MAARTDDVLVDIDLFDGQDFTLDNFNDLSIVEGNTATVYGLIRRLLVERGTWGYDPTFGSELYTLLRSKSIYQVTDDEIRDIVYDAVSPMLFDGRIDEIVQVRISKREKKSITIEITVRIGTDVLTTNLTTPQI